MIKLLTNKVLSTVAAVATAAFVAFAGQAQAAESPFDGLNGTWSGSGAITLASGAKEQIRCKASYNVDGSGANLSLTLRCASDSYKFELTSNVAHSGGAVSGTWAETTNRVGGTISGSASSNRINVNVLGTISARLALSTKANQQSISIESPGSPMTAVAISLSRGK